MKKTILIFACMFGMMFNHVKAQAPNPAANPFITSITAAKNQIGIGETTTVSMVLGNSGTDPIPAGGVQWNISFPPSVIAQQATINFNGAPLSASWNTLAGIGTFLTITVLPPGIPGATVPPSTTTSYIVDVDITGGTLNSPLQLTGNVLHQPSIVQNVNPGDDNASSSVEVLLFPLPLSINTFDVHNVNCSAVLRWSTLSEQKTKEFVVERSEQVNSNNYLPVGVVAANGNSSTLKNYEFIDVSVEEGVNYQYRLRMVDIDGKYTQSDIKAFRMNCNKSNNTLSLYPSPSVKMITIIGKELDINEGEHIDIEFYNAVGQLVRSERVVSSNGSLTYSADVASWAEGNYFVNLKGRESNLKETLRFIKIK